MTLAKTFKIALFSLLGLSAVHGPAAAQADAPLLAKVPPGTVLTIGDPVTQKALEVSGLDKELSFEVKWANISGGPQTSEAFRAHALDVGSVAEIPSIFANWNNLPVRNIAYRERRDPIANPIYRFGIAPGAAVKTLADFRGKRIAFSPGQAQGTLVLRALHAAGLKSSDVTLVELPSTGDVYPKALASKQVDIAPLGGVYIRRYIGQYGSDGATLVEHGLRDDPSHLYAPQWVLDDPAKAAALAEYVGLWARATEWVNRNPDLWIKEYYVGQQGLSQEDGEFLVKLTGEQIVPADWGEVKKRHQETINLLADELGYQSFDVERIFDNRFEKLGAAALAKSQ
ncbi:sulfonate transport system substrate-binding protein [Rhizobium sp. BK077]|uniref:ABC transporter substrate-binding protein n=1 Tax=unclassified Rhizobium TaxID=2613769 RepID=UPI0006470AE5|nr:MULTISPECIES: ABC transporter substrate-binding protein [unclassified Rhizobium]MBB3300066.1 sulfonate transport system substrate-binding protein [Rhizobium sp. BK112]MBB3369523.1 sulfonate transport system substrate-binding protein [Rhizobium sp. BK077]MBB4179932.1 sulfonate transport system substrate-binding protein [Rhizobium sp. BK109]